MKNKLFSISIIFILLGSQSGILFKSILGLGPVVSLTLQGVVVGIGIGVGFAALLVGNKLSQ